MNDNRRSKLGAALAQMRRQNGWTLADMSARTGLSVSTLSKVEHDRISLTYDKLVQLSERLSIDISQLFAPVGSNGEVGTIMGRRSINRPGEGQLVSTRNYDYRYLSTDVVEKKFIPMIGVPRAHSIQEFGELVRHSGEEFVYVIEGTIEVHTSVYAPFTLTAGESAYLDSTMGHAYIQKGTGPCRVLAICSASQGHLLHALEESSTPASATPPAKARPAAPRTRSKSRGKRRS